MRRLEAYAACTPLTWHSGTTAKITRRAKLEKVLGAVQFDINAFAFTAHKSMYTGIFFYIYTECLELVHMGCFLSVLARISCQESTAKLCGESW